MESIPPGEHYLSAEQAAQALEIKLSSLYAYVSRGLIRSFPAPGRGHLYARDDIERLKARSGARRGHAAVAAGALRFGDPVLESAITSITQAGPRYRGHSAIELARSGTSFEHVAELLWTGVIAEGARSWRADGLGVSASRLKALVPNETGPITRLQLLVPAIAMGDPARFSAPDDAEHERARRLILRMASSLALRADVARLKRALRAPSVANALCEALGIASKDAAVDALNQLLILVADHELNVSTLAARAAASAGADLYGCISAALAALSGPRHGGNCDRIEALVREAEKPDRATNAVRARTRRGEQIPGFGHPLYASGDPRTRPLLDAARALRCRSPSFSTLMSIVDVMQTEGREAPTLDLGIVAISLALSLPESSATALFALGRSAGWVAHVLEQRSEGYPLRPRARYVGV